MEFDASYFEGEEKDGFYVRPLMKRVWAAQLEVLKEIDIICRHHNIKYFADWGTLLGAVRHKGYIPWDDDIDIGMLRKDFMRFLHYAKQELPEGYVILDINNENYGQLWACVKNGQWILPEDKDFLEKFHGCPYNVGVDIFYLDNIPKNRADEEVLLEWLTAAYNLGKLWDTDKYTLEEKDMLVRQIEEQTKFHFSENAPMKKQLLQLSDKIAAMYYDDDEAEEAAPMALLADGSGYRIPRAYYDHMVEVPFENISIPIPVEYDKLLRLMYGDDYMTPNRDYVNDHIYPYFRNQVETLRNTYKRSGLELPECFDWKE